MEIDTDSGRRVRIPESGRDRTAFRASRSLKRAHCYRIETRSAARTMPLSRRRVSVCTRFSGGGFRSGSTRIPVASYARASAGSNYVKENKIFSRPQNNPRRARAPCAKQQLGELAPTSSSSIEYM